MHLRVSDSRRGVAVTGVTSGRDSGFGRVCLEIQQL